MSVVTLAVVGAGGRGNAYADWALAHPGRARVVAVAEPRERLRDRFAEKHGIPAERCFTDWSDLLEAGRIADAVLVCTQDREHVVPAVAFAKAGWHQLLEKPLAPTPAECVEIIDAAHASGSIFAVCHVLRYAPYTVALKELLDSGRIGGITGIQHLEPVAYWHFAHSYVRGPWRREADSSSMLMAKSSHDLDWMRHIVGRPIRRVSSFGSLEHFHPGNAPAGSTDRCVTCPVEKDCAYSAPRIYQRRLDLRTWPMHHVVDVFDQEHLDEAMRTGPYGRCVYTLDNDVVDQQSVNVEFEGGISGTFMVNAFNPLSHRLTRVFGSLGFVEGDGETLKVFDFRTEETETIKVEVPGDATAGGGHGGGDSGLMDAFTAAVAAGDPRLVLSGPEESLESHLAVFAAERARIAGTVETVARAE